MTATHEDLWRRIQEFPIDDCPVELPFVRRLARENGWSDSHTERVLTEYRKFLFLAAAAGHPVTPSDAVDQAWHLHLTYSTSYWDRLCGEVLQRPLHHHRTQGGANERRKYVDAYARTLESYRRQFGTPPPAELWPDPRLRFGRDFDFQRINTRENVVLSRRRLRQVGLLACLLAVGGLALAFGEGVVATIGEAFWKHGSDFLLPYWMTCGAALVAGVLLRRGLRQPDDDPRAEDLQLHPYEAAYLAAGEQGAVDVALIQLFGAGKLRYEPTAGTLAAVEDLPEDAHMLARALHQGARRPKSPAALRSSALASLEAMAGRLRAQGLVVSAGRAFLGTAVPLAMLALPVVLGLMEAVPGLGRGRPILLLLGSLIVTGGAAWWMIANGLRCSGRGCRVLKRLRKNFPRRETDTFAAVEAGMTWGAALFGLGMLSDTPWAGYKSILGPPVRSSSMANGVREDGCGGCG